MENIPFPTKITYEPDTAKNTGTVAIEPCYPGYGTTWGNALRRVLLSSLPGAAVTAVKIRGVKHEFSTMPHVKEDVLEIILNLKQLRLKVFTEEPVVLNLKVKGEKKVKASDIEPNAQVEIANPELDLATLTDKKAALEAKIWVEKGRGYVPVEERERPEEMEADTIMIDSVYSPVLKVGLGIENVRVGKRTDYDRLKMKIETDGTITPKDAFLAATGMLVEQFGYLAGFGEAAIAEEAEAKKAKPKKKKEAKPKKAKPKAEKKKEVKKKAIPKKKAKKK